MAEHDFDVRQFSQALQQKLCGLELLALHDKGMLRVVLENGVVELRDQLAARPVPELEDRRDQPDARHVGGEAVLGQQIKRRRMGGGGARIGLRAVVLVEQPHRNALAAQQPGTQ